MADWRDPIVDGITLQPGSAHKPDPLSWPGYEPRSAVRWGVGDLPGTAGIPTTQAAVCVWDFSVYGGSYGMAETNALVAAVDAAIAARVPLVTWARTGGTRLQEGMGALVGIPASLLALRRLSEAGLAHVAIADHPTTGGVWVGITSGADVRIAVAGATIGFAGPRVVEAMTGAPLAPGEHTAASAFEHGLVDAVVTRGSMAEHLSRTLRAVSGTGDAPPDPLPDASAARLTGRSGWEQVVASRESDRPDGHELVDALLTDGVALHGSDPAVHAAVGLVHGRSTVAVALAARKGARPGPAGYALAIRATQLAGRLGWPLVMFVDTPGADPRAEAEHAGIASAIGSLMDAVLRCPSPTVSVVHGEGGSGGALAAAVTDHVLVSPLGYFAAIAPEGAAQALKMDAVTAADYGEMTPERLLSMGIADGVVPTAAADNAVAVTQVLTATAAEEKRGGADARISRRLHRWSATG